MTAALSTALDSALAAARQQVPEITLEQMLRIAEHVVATDRDAESTADEFLAGHMLGANEEVRAGVRQALIESTRSLYDPDLRERSRGVLEAAGIAVADARWAQE